MANKDGSKPGVARRTVLHGIATGLAGAVAGPSIASAGGSPTQSTESADPGPAPRLLNAHDHETLVSLADVLVPGSVAAGVADLLDRVAAVDVPENQRALLAAVRAFEGEARETHGSRWVELTPDVHETMLEEAVSGTRPALSEPLIRLRNAVAEAYFATEPGMRRLGWTPRSAWRELPSCDHQGDDHR